jgi:TatA/E family protein of Tat protein translocase
MFGIGMPEMLLILAIALIVIGPKKLPDLAKSLGRAIGEFRKAASDLKDTISVESDMSNVKASFENLGKEKTSPVDSKAQAAEPPSNSPADEPAATENQEGETPPKGSGESPH